MALRRKAVNCAFRSSGTMRSFWRSVTSTADRDCGHKRGSGESSVNPGSFMGWAAGLALAGGLGLVQVCRAENSGAKPLEECINGISTPGISSISDFKGQDSDVTTNEVDQRRKARYFLPDAFRRRVFFYYEKRIRIRSSPEKVFEYFASVQTPEGELLMTHADLMRAVVPVFPPSDSDVVRDGFLRGERPAGELKCPPSEFFILFDTNRDGLISFPEYIFFVTLLSVPESDILTTFKMFDLDYDGKIDREEFKKVMKLMRTKHRQGIAHRDGWRTGLKVEEPVDNGGLVEYFFGEDGKHHLQLENFEEFIRDLQKEIIRLEFQHYDYRSQGTISAKDFALSMVAAADMNHINQYLDRVDELGKEPNLKSVRISPEEFWSFVELRKKIQPLALAMLSFGEVYGLVTKTDFQRAASHVCNVSVTDNLVDIIYYVFDTNKDGRLSVCEFLQVLDRRERDIVYPREYGVVHLLTSWLYCAKYCHYCAKYCRSECIRT